MNLTVNEIFYSIQGESSFAGCPCAFVRLAGCNLRCSYCDTRYAYQDGDEVDLNTILKRIAAYACPCVSVTGGEPLLQGATPRLITRLLKQGYTVLLETNGSMDISAVDRRCIRVVDIKCPSSNHADSTDFANIARLTGQDELKFVIGTRDDYDYARSVLDRMRPAIPVTKICFSPAAGMLKPVQLADWILEDGLRVRLSLQLHKILWPSQTRAY